MSTVELAAQAERDLRAIRDFYLHAPEGGEGVARSILDQLEQAALSLETLPGRGSLVPELERVGVRAFRELHVKPYRMIYEIRGEVVIVHAVLDARRDVQTLLADRLLRWSAD